MAGFLEKIWWKISSNLFSRYSDLLFWVDFFLTDCIMGFITINRTIWGEYVWSFFPASNKQNQGNWTITCGFFGYVCLTRWKIEGKAREASYEFGSKTTRHELKWYAGGFFLLVLGRVLYSNLSLHTIYLYCTFQSERDASFDLTHLFMLLSQAQQNDATTKHVDWMFYS